MKAARFSFSSFLSLYLSPLQRHLISVRKKKQFDHCGSLSMIQRVG
jgi:hypothetical protein